MSTRQWAVGATYTRSAELTELHDQHGTVIGEVETPEQAACIVKACNSYDKLVAACRMMMANLCGRCAQDHPCGPDKTCDHHVGHQIHKVLKEVDR